MTFKF